jgi:hypothetical protein
MATVLVYLYVNQTSAVLDAYLFADIRVMWVSSEGADAEASAL